VCLLYCSLLRLIRFFVSKIFSRILKMLKKFPSFSSLYNLRLWSRNCILQAVLYFSLFSAAIFRFVFVLLIGSLILIGGQRDGGTLGSCCQFITYRPEAVHIQTLPNLQRGLFPPARSWVDVILSRKYLLHVYIHRLTIAIVHIFIIFVSKSFFSFSFITLAIHMGHKETECCNL
jgi:hypothetical protein